MELAAPSGEAYFTLQSLHAIGRSNARTFNVHNVRNPSEPVEGSTQMTNRSPLSETKDQPVNVVRDLGTTIGTSERTCHQVNRVRPQQT